MQTVKIHYFSGTGNSARAANIIGKFLANYGYYVRLQNIENQGYAGSKENGLNVVIFPVYACAVPEIMQKYISTLPFGRQEKAAVIAVYGDMGASFNTGYTGGAFDQAKRMLKRRNYDVFLTDAVAYPVNTSIIAHTPSQQGRENIFEKADMKVLGIANKIAEIQPSFKKCWLINRDWSWIFGMSLSLIGRRHIGKLYVATNSCRKCGRCIKDCPANTIKMVHNSPRWGIDCHACLRSINSCPENAIQVSVMRLAASIGLVFIPYYKIAGLSTNALLLFKALYWVGGYLACLLVVDFIFAFLERIKMLQPLMHLNFTYKFRRYLEPSFQPK